MLVICTLVALVVGFVAGALVVAVSRKSPQVRPAAVVLAEGASEPQVRDELSQVLDRLDLAVVICDPDGQISYRNRSAMAMQGTHVGVIVDAEIDEALTTARSTGSTERRLDLHGPPRMSLELRAERLNNEWVVALVEDVSERSRIDAMRTDFVANISHELKTPVGAIALLAEALDGEVDPEVITMMSVRLVDESHRAATTIDDLLELARIESASTVSDVVDLDVVVEQALARGRSIDESVSVEAVGAASGVMIRGDARQLTSAIGNLVENAVKYSDPEGQVHIRTRVDERSIEVVVSDQGVGIPVRDLDRVFERFYRVDRARSRTTGGTGLGLAIVRHVATNHGGDVVVSSQEGEGSTFILRLPAALRVNSDNDGQTRGADGAMNHEGRT